MKGLLPALEPDCDDLVIAFDENLRGPACQVARKLRQQQRKVDVQLMPNKKVSIPWAFRSRLTLFQLAWCYSYADRVGARRVVLVAPSEWAEGKVRIKDLRSDKDEKEQDIKFEDL